jgi:hypothetical protein
MISPIGKVSNKPQNHPGSMARWLEHGSMAGSTARSMWLGPGNTFSKYDSKYFRFVCISKCFKILYGSDQKTLKIHLKRLRSEGRTPVVRSGTHIGRSHYVGDTVARARGGVRNTSGFTVMSPPGAPGGCGEARGVPHLNKRNVGHAE